MTVARAHLLAPLFFAFGCAVPIRASISPAELLGEVRTAELARDGQSPAVERALLSPQRQLRIAGLMALARSQEVDTASKAMALLGDRDPEVATWAAFTLSRLADPPSEAALRGALRGVSIVPEEALLGLGRAASASIAPEIASFLADERPKVRAASALALGLMAKRLPKMLDSETFTKILEPLLKDEVRDVRFGATYALFRISGNAAAVALIAALGDADPEIRATAIRGLSAAGASPHVLDPVVSDPDWRVRAEVAKALGEMALAAPPEQKAATARLLALVPREFARFQHDQLAAGRATHVLLQVIHSATQLGVEGKRVLEALEGTPWNTEGLKAETVGDQARLQCAIAFAFDRLDREVKRVRSCGQPTVPEWRRLALVARLLAYRGGQSAIDALSNLTVHQDPRVRVAAVEALGELKDDASSKALFRLLDSNDPYMVSAAAELLGQTERNRVPAYPSKLRQILAERLADMDASLAVGIIDAAGGLGKDGSALLPELTRLATDTRPAVRRRAADARAKISGQVVAIGSGPVVTNTPPPVRTRQLLELTTTKGAITIELFGDVAPHTTGMIVALVKEGFYANKSFHRIVPDFVAQGGCPRGDGWGGPGYTIVSEGSPLPFVRGTLGIATNGLDTGGSQFFIMHSYQPHLDGQYALAGRVMQGIEVVDAIQQDDLILSADVKPMNVFGAEGLGKGINEALKKREAGPK